MIFLSLVIFENSNNGSNYKKKLNELRNQN